MRSAIVVLSLLAWTSDAQAFHEVASFARTANRGGGANSYYTGSSRFKGYDCNICHVGAEHRISIEIDGPLRSGQYEPGLIHPITIRLRGEHRGLESAFNPNTFSLDVTSADGTPIGVLRRASGTSIELIDEGTVAVAEGLGNGEDEWELTWWAPDDGVPATLHIAMLDGDGASDPERRFIDPLNDDVASLRIELCPSGATCDPPKGATPESSRVGCAVGSEPWTGVPGLLLILMSFFALRLRRGLRGRHLSDA